MASYYGIVFSEFWTGDTGAHIREAGKDALILAFYLMSCRHGTMLGLYRLPYADIRYETGLGLKGIARAFDALEQHQFAAYDVLSQHVWVKEMAKFRLGLNKKPLEKTDKRVTHVRKMYDELPENPFLAHFYDRYHTDLFLVKRRRALEGAFKGLWKGHGSPLQASKQITVNSTSNQNTEDQDQPALARRNSVACGNLVEKAAV